MPKAPEYATASRYYFEAGDIKEEVKEFSNIGIDSTPTEANMGSGKGAKWILQPKPTPPKPQNPTVVIYGSKSTKLYDWYSKCNPNTGGVSQWESLLRDASVTVYDLAGKPSMVWQIKQCYPCKYSVSSLTASGTDLVTETIDLVPQEIIREK